MNSFKIIFTTKWFTNTVENLLLKDKYIYEPNKNSFNSDRIVSNKRTYLLGVLTTLHFILTTTSYGT